ncbi:MAG: hypothetical protein WD426_11020 [Anditalea sp.]
MAPIHYIEHTEDLYQNAPFGYLSMLIHGEIINVNNTLLKWLDFSRDEIIRQKSFQDLMGIGDKIYYESYLMPLQMQGEVSEINLELRGS